MLQIWLASMFVFIGFLLLWCSEMLNNHMKLIHPLSQLTHYLRICLYLMTSEYIYIYISSILLVLLWRKEYVYVFWKHNTILLNFESVFKLQSSLICVNCPIYICLFHCSSIMPRCVAVPLPCTRGGKTVFFLSLSSWFIYAKSKIWPTDSFFSTYSPPRATHFFQYGIVL